MFLLNFDFFVIFVTEETGSAPAAVICSGVKKGSYDLHIMPKPLATRMTLRETLPQPCKAKDLPNNSREFEDHKNDPVIVVCRAGVRSTTAAALLTGLGFQRVSNLRGGMLDWNEQGLPVER